jgi:signal transduction histidine kinase
LSIVRSIATAHGGRVTARPNAIDGGLTVRVRLAARQSLNRHANNREEGEKEPAKVR